MISYKPLFRLLLDKNMTKSELRKGVGFSPSTLSKISKNEYVALEIIDRICTYLNCNVGDVIEHLPVEDIKKHHS